MLQLADLIENDGEQVWVDHDNDDQKDHFQGRQWGMLHAVTHFWNGFRDQAQRVYVNFLVC